VVLCHVVAEKACDVCRFQELQSTFIELMQGRCAPVDPVEQSKGHLCHGMGPPFHCHIDKDDSPTPNQWVPSIYALTR
jgi:hypothetical protein